MGNLVFQATLGGQVNLVGPNTASTFNINVPATAGTMVTTGDTGTVTNTMLASSAYTAPGTIGSGTPNTGAFTTLSATGNVTLGDATTDTLNVGAGGLVKDASGNVGIGTASPSVKLQVSTSGSGIQEPIWLNNAQAVGAGVGARLVFTGTTSNNGMAAIDGAFAGATTADGGYMSFNTRAVTTGALTERMRLDASGNLGLGVTPSAWNSVFKSLDVGTTASFVGSSGGANVFNNAYYNGSDYIYKTTAVALRYLQSDVHAWFTAASGTAGNAITFTQAMTLDASGNLGVGATSPSGKLHIQRASAGNLIYANDGVAGGLTVSTSGFGCYLDTQSSAGFFAFTKNGGATETARIDSSGNFTVGATAGSWGSASGNQVSPSFQQINKYNGSSGDQFIAFSRNSSTIGSITQAGTTGVLYNITSDKRLKENIVDAPEFGSVIDAIQVRSYDWITDQTHQRAGFIAQELVTVAPEAVHIPSNEDEMMAVDYSKLVPMLVKEIQSLRQRVASLEA